MRQLELLKKLAQAANELRAANKLLEKIEAANDLTKRFDRALMRVELAEDALYELLDEAEKRELVDAVEIDE